MPPTEALDLADYGHVSSGTIGHALDHGFLDWEIQSLVRPVRVLGRAMTVSCQPTDNSTVVQALARAEPGDVLVIARHGDRRHACWGGILSLAAQAKGIAGVIVDGAATDWAEIQELRFPVFCRNLSSLTTRKRDLPGTVGEPIVCGGALVRRGDIVLGDEDGVVVVEAEAAAEVLAAAARQEAKEERMKQLLRSGMTLAEMRVALAAG